MRVCNGLNFEMYQRFLHVHNNSNLSSKKIDGQHENKENVLFRTRLSAVVYYHCSLYRSHALHDDHQVTVLILDFWLLSLDLLMIFIKSKHKKM